MSTHVAHFAHKEFSPSDFFPNPEDQADGVSVTTDLVSLLGEDLGPVVILKHVYKFFNSPPTKKWSLALLP